MKNVSLKLPKDLDRKLTHAARQKGISKSRLIRQALAAYLSGNLTQAGSFTDQAGDLSGCVSSAPDLASNEEHLSEYGR